MQPLLQFLERVDNKVAAIRAVHHTHQSDRRGLVQALAKLRDSKFREKSHCSTCGLPLCKHVARGAPSAKEGDLGYLKALQALTDAEFVALLLPISERRLAFMTNEALRRISRNSTSRWVHIADDDGWL